MLVSTGGVYRAGSGKKVGPLRPFRDGIDSPASDIMGRSAWFYADGVGAFDRHGEWLTGGTSSPNNLVAEWDGPEDIDPASPLANSRELTVGVQLGFGLLLANVKASGDAVQISQAWIEASGIPPNIRLTGAFIDALGIARNGGWLSFRDAIRAAAFAEVNG